VNQAALTYLKTYSKSYSLDSLKSKLISSGYTKEDVEEAAAALGQKQEKASPEQHFEEQEKEVKKPIVSSSGEKKGFNWIKFGGVCGFIILIYLLEFVVTSFFIDSIQESLGSIFNIFMWVFTGIALLCVFFFYRGFYILGKSVDSKLIRFASISMIIVLLALIVIGVGGFAGVNYQASSAGSITGEVIGEDFLISEDGVLSGSDVSMSPFVIILISIIALAAAFLFVVQIIFSIGLIRVKEKVRFSQVSGIFNLIWTILNISIFVALVYILINLFVNPAFVVDLMFLLSGRIWIYNSFEISFIVLFFFTILFESIALLILGRRSEFGELESVQAGPVQVIQQTSARPVHAKPAVVKPIHTVQQVAAKPTHTRHVRTKPKPIVAKPKPRMSRKKASKKKAEEKKLAKPKKKTKKKK